MSAAGFDAQAELGDHKIRGSEIVPKSCPFCGKPNTFAMHAHSGAYNCKAGSCGKRGGSFRAFLAARDGRVPARPLVPRPARRIDPSTDQLAREYHAALMADQDGEVFRWLRSARRIGRTSIERWMLGQVRRHGELWLSMPYRVDGTTVKIKLRTIRPPEQKKECRWIPSGDRAPPAPLYMSGTPSVDEVVIAEGELDAITWTQHGWCGVSPANGAGDWDLAWNEPLADTGVLYLAYDADDAGAKGAAKAADALGAFRCRRATVVDDNGETHKDANDAVAAGWGAAVLKRALADAVVDRPEHIVTFEELEAQLIEDERVRPMPDRTGWSRFDQLFYGWVPRELTVVSGDTKQGKTTWTLDVFLRLIARGVPALYATLEMSGVEIYRKLIEMQLGMAYEAHVTGGVARVSQADREKCLETWGSYAPARIMLRPDECTPREIMNGIEYARLAHGVRWVCLDNLDWFARGGTSDEQRIAKESAVRDLTNLAHRLDLHVVLVVHPTADAGRKPGRNARVTMHDLKGTAAIKQDAHNILIVQRVAGEQRRSRLHIDAGRRSNVQDRTHVDFEFDRMRFRETDRGASA